MNEKPPGAGGRSFELIDPVKVFKALRLKNKNRFLDMACGRGDYAIAASKIVGEAGLIYAVDLWEESLAQLRDEVEAKGIRNIKAFVADIRHLTTIENESIDVCLMATVLHDLIQEKTHEGAIKEAGRVLKSKGSLAIIEFNKVEGPPGPPIHIRLSPEDVERTVTPHGFKKIDTIKVGPYNYLITFSISGTTGQVI